MAPKIFPSVMAKDQEELSSSLAELKGVSKVLHLDVVDGKFADSHYLDFDFKLSRKFRYNAHLMVKRPEIWIKKHGRKVDFYAAHFEALKNPAEYIKRTKKRKKKVAIALLPETAVDAVRIYLNEIDIILLLTVHPGFYGSKFLPSPLRKIGQIKKINPRIKIIVDGNMNLQTIKIAGKAGADWFVAGSFIQNAPDKHKAIRELKKSVSSLKS